MSTEQSEKLSPVRRMYKNVEKKGDRTFSGRAAGLALTRHNQIRAMPKLKIFPHSRSLIQATFEPSCLGPKMYSKIYIKEGLKK